MRVQAARLALVEAASEYDRLIEAPPGLGSGETAVVEAQSARMTAARNLACALRDFQRFLSEDRSG